MKKKEGIDRKIFRFSPPYNVMIFTRKVEGFDPKFEIVGVFCEHEGKILLLHRNDNKPQGNTWGVPAGKVEDGEDITHAILRELEQETGISIDPDQLKYFTKLYVRYPEYDFVYHIFHLRLNKPQNIKINSNEHKGFVWIEPRNALKLNLIGDLGKCIKLFYGLK